MKNAYKMQDGFTLVEVIISIAILSIASVVALQLFMTSQNLNTKSRQTDIASILSTNMIEVLRTEDSVEGLLSTFEGMVATDTGYEMVRSLNQDFETMDAAMSENSEKNLISYTSLMRLTASDTPGLYDVTVTLTRTGNEDPLVTYLSKHYFKEEVATHVE